MLLIKVGEKDKELGFTSTIHYTNKAAGSGVLKSAQSWGVGGGVAMMYTR